MVKRTAGKPPRKATLINIVLIALIISISSVLIINYLLNTFLPDKINTYAKDFTYTHLRKRIQISRIEVDLFKGIELRDVSLFTLHEKTPYVSIHRVRALPFYPSFLSNKKWLFSLTLDGITFTLARTKDSFNIPKISDFGAAKGSLFINVIAIKDLDLTYQDAVTGFTGEFKHLFCVINMSFPHAVHLQARWPEKVNIRAEYNLHTRQSNIMISLSDIDLSRLNIYSGHRYFSKAYLEYASIVLSGKDTYQLKINAGIKDFLGADPGDSFSAQHMDLRLLLSGIAPGEMLKILKNDPIPVQLSQARAPMEAHLRMEKVLFTNGAKGQADRIATDFSSKDARLQEIVAALSHNTPLPETLHVDAYSQIQNFACSRDGVSLTGNADAYYQFPLPKEANRLSCALHQGYMIVPGFGELKNIETVMELGRDSLTLSKIAATYKGQAIDAKATITNFEAPMLYAEFQGTYPITWLLEASPDMRRLKAGYYGDATASLQGKLKGNITKQDYRYFVEFTLKGLDIGDFHDIQAKGYAQKDRLVIHEARVQYKKIPLTLAGSLENFASPDIFADIEGPNFLAKTHARVRNNSIDVQDLVLSGVSSKITSKGEITLAPRAAISLTGSGTLDCEDLFAWRRSIEINNLLDHFGTAAKPALPKFFSKFNKDNLKGSLNIKFIAKGGDNPDEWEIKLAGYGQSMQIFRVKALNPRIEFFKNKNELTISPLTCDVASGKLEFRTHVDFAANKAKFDVVGNDLDLTQLRDQLQLKNKKLAGLLSFEAYVDNNSLSSWDKLDGEGKIQIKSGNIAELNLVRGLGEFLFIPDFDEIIFEEGSGDLYFRNNQIIIDNIALNSLQMTIKGGGKVSLSGPIHFLLFPEFNPKLISASDSLKKITTGLLGKALLVEIQGTIAQPHYQVKPTILYPLNKIKSFFNELLN